MCGIAGIVGWNDRHVDAADVKAMCDAIVHRGPDDSGIYAGPGVAIGMRRLSIIDLATGRQPVRNEDGTVWVVFNGEIYNFKELRVDLESRGHQFYTTSDTETIVHLYEEFGDDLVTHLRGMFAFAVWDVRQRRLLIARDRLGIKPLYFARLKNGLAFGSELKALLQLPEIERELSWPAVSHLFAFLATSQTESIVRGVEKLEPAHRLVVTADGRCTIDRYWDVEFEAESDASESDLIEELRERLSDTVRLHLRSDVPLGMFLSGGIDSSAVLAAMHDQVPSRVKTFSIGFAEEAFNELPYAREVARTFDTDHHELVLEPQSVDLIESLTWYLDEPFGDSSAIPTFMVSKLAAEHVKVVLSGDGGDELFAGYDKYVVEGRERQRDELPQTLRRMAGAFAGWLPEGVKGRRFLRHLALSGAERYVDSVTLFGADQQRALLASPAATIDPSLWRTAASRVDTAGSRWLSALQRFDLDRYLPLDILTKVDRMTMAHSIEARPALLDHTLVEFAARVPERLRMQGGVTKHLFKKAMRGLLPDAIIDRPKHGFAVPLTRWFRGGEWAAFAGDVLLSRTCRDRGIFNPGYVEKLLRLQNRGRDLDLHLWTLISFEQWCRMFVDRSATPLHARAATSATFVQPALAC